MDRPRTASFQWIVFAGVLAAAASGLVMLSGCAAGGQRISDEPYDGPNVRIERRTAEADRPALVLVRLTAPTGGWRFTLDETRRTDVNGDETLQVFATLQQPADDEAVTMALEQHTIEQRVDDDLPSHTEVFIRQAVRGEERRSVEYRLAGRDP